MVKSQHRSQVPQSWQMAINSEFSIFEHLIQKNFMPVQPYHLELWIPRMPKKIGAAGPLE